MCSLWDRWWCDGTFWSTIEQTSSLTADSDWSQGSRVTVSLVSPIWSRKETPWMEPREFVRLGAVWLPLENRLQRVAGGLGDGDGVGGAMWWVGAKKERGDAGGGLLSADIGCYLWRCPGSRELSNGKDIKNTAFRFSQSNMMCPSVSSWTKVSPHWGMAQARTDQDSVFLK